MSEQQAICGECGGDCSPECGRHQCGCVARPGGYWEVVLGCRLDHWAKPHRLAPTPVKGDRDG